MSEEWRPVVGYEGIYEVSDRGRVRNMAGRVLAVALTNWGYHHLGLRKNGVSRTWRLHRVVAMAFVPMIEGKPHVNHINGDKLDNRAVNLEWMTKRENEAHANAIGRSHAATNPKRGWKLTVENVADIRARFAAGERGCDIHRSYQHVNLGYLYKVCRGLKRERDAQPHGLQKTTQPEGT